MNLQVIVEYRFKSFDLSQFFLKTTTKVVNIMLVVS